VRVLKSKCCEFHEDGSYATTIYIATMQEKNDFNVRVVGWRDVVSLALIFVVVSRTSGIVHIWVRSYPVDRASLISAVYTFFIDRYHKTIFGGVR
jgi:hypothetical protein